MSATEPPNRDSEPDAHATGDPAGWASWESARESPMDILDGRYLLQDEIGAGASATTYRALDQRLGRWVAVKVLRSQYAHDPIVSRRFEREARTAASVSRPHVVKVHDIGRDADRLYIVLEYIDGENLKERLVRKGPLDQAEAVRLAREVLAALAAIHRAGIIHRDIKPQNILIDRDGSARLADFGIAHLLADTGLTTTGTTLGTAWYMAPEQAQGEPLVPATDLYAVGVVLYEMLTGQLPFDALSTVAVIYAHLQAQPVPLSHRAPERDIAPALDRLVLRALAKRPYNRFVDADAMSRALALALPPDPGDARAIEGSEARRTAPIINARAYRPALPAPASPSGSAGAEGYRSLPNGRILAWALALLILVAAGIAGGSLWLVARDSGPGEREPTAAVIAGAPSGGSEVAVLHESDGAGVRFSVASSPATTDTLVPTATETPLPTATPTETPSPTPTETPVPPPTQEPTAPPAPTAPPTDVDALGVLIDSESTADDSLGSSAQEGSTTVEEAPSQVIEPADQQAHSASEDDAGARSEPIQVEFTASDWRGAYYQSSGNLQPWSALYAQSTGYGQASLAFDLPGEPAAGTFVVMVEGMTSENWTVVPMEIHINGQVVYADSSPFPTWNGIDGQQPWTTITCEFPTAPLKVGENTVTFVNGIPEGGFSLPPYLLLADGTLTVEVE